MNGQRERERVQEKRRRGEEKRKKERKTADSVGGSQWPGAERVMLAECRGIEDDAKATLSSAYFTLVTSYKIVGDTKIDK